MIVTINAFLVYCFALNIKSIESARNHKVTPIQFYFRQYSRGYGCNVNSIKTFNRKPNVISTKEMNALTKRGQVTYKELEMKKTILKKLYRKIQDVKCSFCVITKSNISQLKNLFEMLKLREPLADTEEVVQRLKEEAGIIVDMLIMGNMETDKWIWSYYLKIIGIGQFQNNEQFIRENPFEDALLQTGVSDYIDYCKARKYLPVIKTESDLLLKYPKVYPNMFRHLRGFGLFSDFNDFFTTDLLYINQFWIDANRLLFRPITEVNVDWTKAKQQHELQVPDTREFVENRGWISNPYGRLNHQRLVSKIIEARSYCYISVVLHIHEKQQTILDRQTLTSNGGVIIKVVMAVLRWIAYKDDFLFNIISELQCFDMGDVSIIRDVSRRVSTKANDILNGLNGISSSTTTSEIDWLGFNVDQNRLSNGGLILTIVKEFGNYLSDFLGFWPLKFKVFLHFIGEVKLQGLS